MATIYSDDIANMAYDESTKHIIRMAREANDSLLEDNSHYANHGIGAYAHHCPFRQLPTARTQREHAEEQYWLSALRGTLYNGVARNHGWRYCKRCNPKGLTAEQARKEIAARKITRYLKRKVPIVKFKRSTTTFANLHLRRGLPADVVGKILREPRFP